MATTMQAVPGQAGAPALGVRHIEPAELKQIVAKGLDDFLAMPTFAVFIVIIYPVIGLALLTMIFGYNLLHLVFPMVAGFPLVGPLAAVGLYELSRRRERGLPVSFVSLFGISRPRLRALFRFGLLLMALLVVWLASAMLLFQLTFGDWAPRTFGELVERVFTTPQGWTLILAGCAVGFVLAATAFAISVVSGPLLIDRDVGVGTAVQTSFRAVQASPAAMALWALIIAIALALGSLPFLIGLAVVLPILGHATWHLYRHVVAD
jgi:uncharacterized membrane protein